jgi:hypothetical protein
VSELLTEEIESGLLPTPMAQNRETTIEKTKERQKKYGGKRRAMYLQNFAVLGMLPTPREAASRGNASKDRGKGNLEDAIAKMMLPTPNAAEGEKYTLKWKKGSQMGTALTPLMNKITGKSSQLKPQFVMEMMGFPPNWTELPFLDGEPNQLKEQETQ